MPGILKIYNSATSTWEVATNVVNSQFTLAENQTPTGSINGSNTTFTLPTGFVAATLKVYKNGVRMKPAGEDYTTTSTGFTMTVAPATGTVLLCDYAFGDGTNVVGGNSLISDEVPTGTVNGSNKVFTTVRGYVGATLEVFINGVKQLRGTDYVETTPSSGTFTMDEAPLTGDKIFVNYSYNLNPSSNADTVDGINANATPTANMLAPLDSSAYLQKSTLGFQAGQTFSPVSGSGTWTRYDLGGVYLWVGYLSISGQTLTNAAFNSNFRIYQPSAMNPSNTTLVAAYYGGGASAAWRATLENPTYWSGTVPNAYGADVVVSGSASGINVWHRVALMEAK